MIKSKIMLIAAMLIFGSIGLVVRGMNFSSSQIALVRGGIGTMFILGVSSVSGKKLSLKAIKPNLKLLILSGAGIGFNWILLFEAYKYTTISNATLSYYFAPVIVMFLSPFILKEKLSILKVISIICAVLGMFFIVGMNGGIVGSHLVGIGCGLLAAIIYATVIIINKFLKGLSGTETTVMQLGMAFIVLFPYVMLTEGFAIEQIDLKSMILLFLIGIVNTGCAYLLYFTSMKNLRSQTIAVYSYIDPIFAIVLSSVFVGEKMTLLQVIGGILILGSTFICEVYDKKVTGDLKRSEVIL